MATSRAAAFFLGLAIAGCGGDDSGGDDDGFASDTTCGVAVGLTGGVTATLAPTSLVACASQHDDEGIAVYFVITGDAKKVERLELSVDGVTKGAVGDAFAARLVLEVGTERYGAVDCTTVIHSHDAAGSAETGDRFRIVGSTSCSGQAIAEGGAAPPVTIERFDWVAPVIWR